MSPEEPIARPRILLIVRRAAERLYYHFYALRCWDAQGVPTTERLRAPGLADLGG